MSASSNPIRVGELMVQAGLLTEEQLEDRLEMARTIGQPLGQILLRSKDVNRYQLICMLQIQSFILDRALTLHQGLEAIELVCSSGIELADALQSVGYNQEESNSFSFKLGEILLEANLINQLHLVDALTDSLHTSLPLGQILVQSGKIRPDVVAKALSIQKQVRCGKVTRKDGISKLRAYADEVITAAMRSKVLNDVSDVITPIRELVLHRIKRVKNETLFEEQNKGPAAFLGKTIGGRYQILSLIGEGGMSFVYLVKHRNLDKVMALKMMQPHHHQDADMIQRFKQEAKSVATLSHPNLVSIHDYGVTEEGFLFFVMDYVKGTTLSQLLKQNTAISLHVALPIFVQMCNALEHAHTKGIIHRDLKPSNIMLVQEQGQKDVVKIVDFGIAKLLTPKDSPEDKITKSGEIFGSPMYMSPEHCMGRELDPRSDVYSMACVMYEMLAGQPPFVGVTAYEIFFKQMNTNPLPLELPAELGKIAEDVNTLVLSCLNRDPILRYQSMTELRHALANLVWRLEKVS